MHTISEEQKDEAMRHVPTEVMEFLFSEKPRQVLEQATRRYKLHVDKVDALAREIMYTAVGLVPGSEFRTVVEEELALPKESAEELYRDIVKHILLPTRALFDKALADMHAREEAQRLADELPTQENAEGDAHALDATRIGVLESGAVRDHAAQAAPDIPLAPRPEQVPVAHVVEEKEDITSRKLERRASSLPQAHEETSSAAAEAKAPLPRDRYPENYDPYREPPA